MNINFQLMKANADRKYVPDFDAMIANAKTCGEVDLLRKAKEGCTGYPFPLIYITRYTCGHYVISLENCPYSLHVLLQRAARRAETDVCGSCKIEREYKFMQLNGIE